MRETTVHQRLRTLVQPIIVDHLSHAQPVVLKYAAPALALWGAMGKPSLAKPASRLGERVTVCDEVFAHNFVRHLVAIFLLKLAIEPSREVT